ncbi:MAG TPA: zinc ribbon domain-containing protein [Bryobacteraceae bacterium]|nr:zinc ribbon domain-containing protein [Bryobacteraceae bacterium]
MAFCTNCGASVEGAFCKNCGTPAASAGAGARAGAAAAAPPPVSAVPPSAPLPPLVQRKTSPIVWILVIVLGLFVLGAIGTLATGYFLVRKVQQAGFDPDLMRRNPGLAISKMVMAAVPDAEVLSTDDGAGTITVRDKKTGKVVTLTFDEARKGKFSFQAEGPDHEKATFEAGGADSKIPSDVPVYPGAKVEENFSVNGNSAEGQGSAATYSFSSPDAPSRVLAFYHDKLEGSGMKMSLNTTTSDGGMLMAEDDARGQAIVVTVGKSGGGSSISVMMRTKK